MNENKNLFSSSMSAKAVECAMEYFIVKVFLKYKRAYVVY